VIILGIIIAALAATGGVAAVTEGANHHTAVTLSVFGKTLPATSAAGVFLVGAAAACVFLLGCTVATTGFMRRVRTRRELRGLRDEHDVSLQALVAEKTELERQLARERRAVSQSQTVAARPLPGGDISAEPFPESDPVAGSLSPGAASGPVPRDSGAPRRSVTAQLYPHLDR
jgi:hypothetical protein